jgi:hypothetical protein
MRILVPVDGSAGSEQALDALSSFFDLESAEVTLLHVQETLWLPHEPWSNRPKAPIRTSRKTTSSRSNCAVRPKSCWRSRESACCSIIRE